MWCKDRHILKRYFMIFREEIHLIDLHEYLYEHYYYLLLKYSISLCAHQIVFDSLMLVRYIHIVTIIYN